MFSELNNCPQLSYAQKLTEDYLKIVCELGPSSLVIIGVDICTHNCKTSLVLESPST